MKWISKGKKKKYSIKRFFKSFAYALEGIISAFKTEQNLLVQTIFGIIVVILGVILKISNIELVIVILTCGLVITLELVNTAIEYVVDMAMPQIHPLAKIAKDVAAGAVLVTSLTAFIVGLIIYLPKIIALF